MKRMPYESSFGGGGDSGHNYMSTQQVPKPSSTAPSLSNNNPPPASPQKTNAFKSSFGGSNRKQLPSSNIGKFMPPPNQRKGIGGWKKPTPPPFTPKNPRTRPPFVKRDPEPVGNADTSYKIPHGWFDARQWLSTPQVRWQRRQRTKPVTAAKDKEW